MTEPTDYPSFIASTAALRSLSRKLSLAVILIGIVVILGWLVDISWLKSFLPELPTMKVNTATCFILSGSSLWLWHQQARSRRTGRSKTIQLLMFTVAFLIILVASLTLIQYGFHVNLGIDQLLMQQPEPVGSLAVPGRMAPNTAFAFFSIGSALLLLSHRRASVGLAQSLAVITWLISFVGLLGHIYGSVYFYTAGSYTGMAIQTAIAFQLVSVGVLCALPDRSLMRLITGEGAGSLMMRQLLPLAIALPILAGGFSLLGYQIQFYGKEVEAALSGTLNILIFAGLVSWNAQSLNSLDWKRRRAEQALQQANVNLEQRIEERTAQLRESEERYSLAIQGAGMGTWDVDLSTGKALWNAQHFKLLGYEPAPHGEAAYEMWQNRVHPDDLERVMQAAEQVMQDRSLYHPEHRILRADTGEVTWMSVFGRALYNEAGEAQRFIGVSLDITARKQAEASLNQLNLELEQRIVERTAELQQTNERLQQELLKREQAEHELQQTLMLHKAILNSANYSIISTTVDGTITSFNAGAEKMLGYSASEVIGKLTPAIIHDPQEVAAQAQMLSQALGVTIEPGFDVFVTRAKRGEVDQCEWSYLRKDGSRFPVLLSVTALRDQDGHLTGFLGIGSDISDRKQAEASRAHLAAIVKDSGDAIIGKSLDGTILSWNNAAEKIFGYKAEDMIGQSITLLIPAALIHEEQQILDTIRRGEIIEQYETVRIRKDGQQIYTSVTVSPLKDATGKIIGASATKRDISDRKRADNERKRMEVALRNSEEQFRHAFEDASIGMAIVSLDGHWLKANPALCQIIGYTADELLPLTFQDLTHPDDLETDLSYVQQLLAGEISTYQLEKRYFHEQGHTVWILLNASLVRDEQEKPLHFLAQIQDITARKHIEAQLRKSEANLLEAQRVAHVGSWELDLITQQTVWSDELFRMMGLPPVNPRPRSPESLNHVHPDDRALVQHCIDQAITNGTPYKIDLRFFRADGELGYMEARGRALQDEQGRIVRLFGTALDISDRKHIEEERLQTEKALRESEARFQAFMNHSPAASWITDANGTILYASQTYCRTFHLSTTEVLGQSVFDLFSPEIAQQFLNNIQTVAQTQQVMETVEVAPRSDGTLGDFLVYKFSVPEESGHTLIGGVAIDITLQHRAEIALQKSEERLQLALEASGEGLWDWEMGKKGYLSPLYQQMLGYQPGELTIDLQRWEDMIHPDDKAWVLDRLHAHLQDSAVPYAYDYRLQTKSGEWKWLANYGKVVARDAQGNSLRMIGMHKDITERKRTETALRESIDRERAIAEVIQHMRQTLDLETIFGATTQELRRVLKCDRVLVYRFNPDWSGAVVAESVGSGWISVIEMLTDGDAVLAAQTMERDRCIIKQWDSQETRLNDTYIQETQGSIYLQGIKHNSVDDIYQANFDPCYVNFLEAFQARAYLTIPIFSNQKLWGLLASYQNADPREWSESEIQVSGQIGIQLGIAIQQAELFAQIQQQSNELQRAKEAAEVANRAKSIFLANMSHELRTPLNVILGFTQVMSHYASLPPEQQEHVKIIHRSGEHLLTLINDVLDLSKIEAERTTFDQSNFDVIALLRSLWEMLRLKAETKGLQFSLDIAEEVPQYITTDANKLRQVLINLLGNAIKFTETGSVMLRVKVGEWESGRVGEWESGKVIVAPPPLLHPSSLLFEVEDTGVGIAATELETIFDAFVQAKPGKAATDGTGLGLTISREFVQLMGSTLSVSSTVGQGSTFRFNLPIQIVNAAEVPLPKTQQRVIGLVPGQPLYRILVVDDQPENRQLLVKLLTQLGLEVRQASDGEEAIALTAQWHPHLVWMDIRMPKVDGYEATQAIRATPEGQAIAIIALTAQASRSDRTIALSAGCNDYLSKPFNEDELFTKMAEHLGLQYVYEDDKQEMGTVQTNSPLNSIANARHTPPPLTPLDLTVMPSDWLAALQQAAQYCDDEEVSHLIEQIPQTYSNLSAGLGQLAHDFQFKQIVQLIQTSD